MTVVQEFTWTADKVELLLKIVKIFKVKKESTGIGWGRVKSKYEDKCLFLFSLVTVAFISHVILEKYIGINNLQLV